MGDKALVVEDVLANRIFKDEYLISLANQEEDNAEYENLLDMLDGQRDEKNYDWQSDIHIPEFISHYLTQLSIDVGQYFNTRDFVEVYLEDEGDEALKAAAAAQECINRTLNRKNLYHYGKYVRAKGINNLSGRVWLKCWWEQKTHQEIVGVKEKQVELDVDINGDPITSIKQIPATRIEQEPVYGTIIDYDHFNYDVWDQRNVFTDDSFVYSIQQKQWVIFRTPMTEREIKEAAELNGYFNLERLKDLTPPDKTESAKETYDKYRDFSQPTFKVEKEWDVLERYGKYWTIADEDELGNPVPGTERIGIDEEGNVLENAKLLDVIITVVTNGSKHILIGFKLTHFIDANGRPYIPAIRGLCYIHPAYDGGMGDGKYTRELQIGIDDTFNLSQDRVMLSTMPTFKVRKTSADDNTTLYFEPGHKMELNDTSDAEEFRITDNIGGALNQIAMLQRIMQQVDAVQPPAMGNLPENASTTATAVATASSGMSTRSNYKSLTFENTALTELYWMILQMTYRFALAETGARLMGDKVYDFDPVRDYYYKPLSQSIETAYNKMIKRKDWISVLQILVQLQHPDAIKMVNYILGKIAETMDDEKVNFVHKFLNEAIPAQGTQGQEQVSGFSPGQTNQSSLPMSQNEMIAREAANVNYG